MFGELTEKVDVFSFGVVALELVNGRPNNDSSLGEEKRHLLQWAWQLHINNCITHLVDHRLSDFNEEEVKRLVGVALLCTQTTPSLRPSMSRVVAMLVGDVEVSTSTSKPGYIADWKLDDSMRTDVASTSTAGAGDHSPVDPSRAIREILSEE